MKIEKVVIEGHRKCKRSKTKAEKLIRGVVRNYPCNEDGKRYHKAIAFIWKDCSLSFLFTENDMDIFPIGKKAHEIALGAMDSNVNKVYVYKGTESWVKMEPQSWKDMITEQIKEVS